MKKLKVVIVGAGHLGTIHTRLMLSHHDVQLLGVVDPCPTARQRVTAEFGVASETSLDAFPLPDAAVIAAPSSLHFEIAAPLLRRGVHLLIEKPVTVELQQALILEQLAERFSTTVAVGHVERFNPAWAGIAERVGRIRYFAATRTGGYTFRSTDVGVVLDLMIHDLDLAGSLLNSAVSRVDAWGMNLLAPMKTSPTRV